MDVVTIHKWKRPAGSGRWHGYFLGRDALGWWIFTPAHSTYTGVAPDGHTETCEVAQDRQLAGRSCVVLLPSDGWYVAHWVWTSSHLVDVDIATPPMRFGDTWSYDDLELDPYVQQDGTFGVDDEVEFETACARGRIGRVEQLHAVEAVRELRRELCTPSSTLMRAGIDRLREGRELQLAPLT